MVKIVIAMTTMMLATMHTKMEVGRKVVNKLLVGGRSVRYTKYLPCEYFDGVDFLVERGSAHLCNAFGTNSDCGRSLFS